jgi:hypothetical protein
MEGQWRQLLSCSIEQTAAPPDAYPRLHGCTPFLGLQIEQGVEEVAVARRMATRNTSVSSLSADCQPVQRLFLCGDRVGA